MADSKISALGTATAPADADVLAGVQGGTTKKFALSSLYAYFAAKVSSLTGASGISGTDIVGGMQGANARKFTLKASYLGHKFCDGSFRAVHRVKSSSAYWVNTVTLLLRMSKAIFVTTLLTSTGDAALPMLVMSSPIE